MSLSEAELEVRSVQIEIMKQRQRDCEDKLNLTLENIPFNNNNNCLVNCPIDSKHFVAEKSFEKHVNICKYKQRGVEPGEIKEFETGTGPKGRILIPNILEENIIDRVKGKEFGSEEYENALKQLAKETGVNQDIEVCVYKRK